MFKDSLNSFRKRIGFTDTEIKIVLFLAVVFIAGFALKLTLADAQADYRNFDYSKQDSAYAAASLTGISADTVRTDTSDNGDGNKLLRRTDYQAKPKAIPADKSININNAAKEDLMRLPGIGEKTAENIIEHRKAHGKFKSIDGLLDVKGIGEKKLEKIKKIIFIE